jgi:hypothetical protein
MHWFPYEIPVWVEGSISYTADHRNFFGDRCTNLTVFQTLGDTIIAPGLFQCNSTLDLVAGGGEDDFQNLRNVARAHIYMDPMILRGSTPGQLPGQATP